MVIVHRELVFRKYSNFGDFCSCLVYILFIILTIIISFLLSFFTENFWLRYNIYNEQPLATFTQDIILTFSSSRDNEYTTKMWTSNKYVNSLIPSNVFFSPEFQYEDVCDIGWTKEFQYIRSLRNPSPDSAVDQFKFKFRIYLEENENVHNVNLLLFFNQEIKQQRVLEFENVVYINHDSYIPGSELIYNGDLIIAQRRPFYIFMKSDSFSEKLFNLGEVSSLDELDFETILKKYKIREENSRLLENYKIWKTGETNVFDLTVEINIPFQQFGYTPWIWEILKHAYVQYFPIFIFVFLILHMIKGCVIRNDYINTKLIQPFKEKQL